jgi:DNA polymerase III gamma/tau subunit
MNEIYKRYRPKTLKGVLGQDGAVASLEKLMAKGLPHALLLSGPSGCGKTTLGRIIKEHLKCGEGDYIEVNSADFKGIDMVRDIRRHANLRPMHGETRVWLIDEAHKLTGDAQNAFLKLLEDTPKHVYFLLATTDPQKLIKTIHTRCSEVKLAGLSSAALQRVLRRVIDKEGMTVSEEVVTEIIEASDGSARKALVILEQVGSLEGDEEQIKAIQFTTFNKDAAISLARALFSYKGTTWQEVSKILRVLVDQDVEGIRYCVLGYARSCLVGKDEKPPNMKFAEKAFKVIDIFSKNFYDSKAAGLAAACWEVVMIK